MSTFVTSIFEDRNFAEMAVAKLESLGYKRDAISVLMDNRTRAKSFSHDTGTTAIDGRARGPRAAVAATLGGALGAIVASAALLGSVRLRAPESERDDDGEQMDVVTPSGFTGDLGPAISVDSVGQPGAVILEPGATNRGSGAMVGGPVDAEFGATIPRAGGPLAEPAAMTAQGGGGSAARPGDTSPLVAGPLRALAAAAGAGGIIGALVGAGLTPDLAKRYERELAGGGILIGLHPRAGDEARVRAALRELAVGESPAT